MYFKNKVQSKSLMSEIYHGTKQRVNKYFEENDLNYPQILSKVEYS